MQLFGYLLVVVAKLHKNKQTNASRNNVLVTPGYKLVVIRKKMCF